MAEEDIPKIGSIQIKSGKATIVVDEEGTREEFDIEFLRKRMLKSVHNVPGFYARRVRELALELKKKGTDELDHTQKVLTTIGQDKRLGLQESCKTWIGWIKNLNMFKNIKTTPEPEKQEQVNDQE